MRIDTQDFLATIRPLLAAGDPDRLARAVAERWSGKGICALLEDPEVEVRRLAAVTLGLVGDGCTVGCLARALHDGDEQVNRLAEDALWSIWFQSGKPAAAEPFHRGVAMIEAERFDQATACLAEATAIDPDFAEAYNQAGIAHFFAHRWSRGVEESERALNRMPAHFGALSGMGHCYAHLEEHERALDCYCRALQINPRMSMIRTAADRLQERLGRPAPRSEPRPSGRA